MCGICGLYWRDGVPAETETVRTMVRELRHRGPDDHGIELRGSVGLGHTRLSIIDVSSAGHQPMVTLDDNVILSYNGEIYNYREIRAELESLGHRFLSNSDSEVLLNAYREWRMDCVHHFNGMWAFAIWDAAAKHLFISRDRLGVKPLYYLERTDVFAFASEIKSLLAAFPEERNPHLSYIHHFLTRGLMDDGPETPFATIRQLQPAHSMIVTPYTVRVWKYWDVDPESSLETYDYTDPINTFSELFESSITLRLRSDVPVGTCLSGGLDSSSVVAAATRVLGGPVRTFSVCYEDAAFSEGRYARDVAAEYGTIASFITPDGSDLLETMEQITWHQDVPSTGAGLYSSWHVMREASRHVKVLLDGQGADELLGGYHFYFVDLLKHRLISALKRGSIRKLAAGLRDLQTVESITGQSVRSAAPRLIRRAMRRRNVSSALAMNVVGATGDLFEAARTSPIQRATPSKFKDPLSNRLYYDTVRDNLPALLHWEDRNSMAFSIEARVPFLDYRLVEFCLALPEEFRIRGTTTKWLLRQSVAADLPASVRNRTDKKGYPTPFAIWLRGTQGQAIGEIFRSPRFRARNMVSTAFAEHALEEHRTGRRDWSDAIWRWVTLEMWFRQFIDGGAATQSGVMPYEIGRAA